MWDIRMVQELISIDTGDAIAHCLAFDKSTKSLAVGCSNAEIKIINIEKGEITSSLKGHEDAVTSLYINHDNSALYSTGNDGSIRIWK
jgi:WD40 repeat protein